MRANSIISQTVTVLFVVGTLIVATLSTATITLNSNPSVLNSTVCKPVTITCTTVQQPSFTWFQDSLDLISFSYPNRDVEFPLSLYDESGITIVVTNAVSESPTEVFFNATSVLTTTTSVLELLNVNSIRCGNVGDARSIDVSLSVEAAPAPSITCSLTPVSGDTSVSIQWSPSQQNVMHYYVSVTPDPSSCSSDQVNPSQVYTCSRLDSQTTYNFTIWAITACGSEIQESERLFLRVLPQVPQIASEVLVEPVYSLEAVLTEVRVQWRDKPQTHISDVCSFQLNYTVTLVDEAERAVDGRVIDSDSCQNGLCNAFFSNFRSSLDYRVTVSAVNGIGMSMNATSVVISGSAATLLQPEFEFDSCLIAATCISSETSGNCTIQYSLSSSLVEASETISTPLNSSITLRLLESNTVYYFEAMVTINSSYTFRRPGNFSTGQFFARLTVANEVFLALGVVAFTLAIIIAVILFIAEGFGRQGSWISLILLVIGAVLLVVCVALWIAVCAVVVPQKNTCDLEWQSDRDGLIIVAMIFSFLTFVNLMTATVMFSRAKVEGQSLKTSRFSKISKSRRKVNVSQKILSPVEKTLNELELDHLTSEDLEKRGEGGRFVAREAPSVMVEEFVDRGKRRNDHIKSKLEEDHVKIEKAKREKPTPSNAEGGVLGEYSIIKCESVSRTSSPAEKEKEYCILNHGTKDMPSQSDEYSALGPGNEKREEYSILQRKPLPTVALPTHGPQVRDPAKKQDQEQYSTLNPELKLADRDDHTGFGTKDEREGREGEGSGVSVSKEKQDIEDTEHREHSNLRS